MPKNDHSDEILRVYDSRMLDGGFWHPAHSDLMGPKGREFPEKHRETGSNDL